MKQSIGEKERMQERLINQAIGPYPGETWFQYASPEDAGYSPRLLEKARDAFKQAGVAALLVIHDGVILLAEGRSTGVLSVAPSERVSSALCMVSMLVKVFLI
jgi:hypothetical protein